MRPKGHLKVLIITQKGEPKQPVEVKAMGASETINIPGETAVRFQDAILEGFQAAIDKEENCDLQVGLISMILGICNSLRGSIFTM